MRGLLAIEMLYHQIVAGRKTQTRRSGGLQVLNDSEHEWEVTGTTVIHNQYGVGLEDITFRTKEYIPIGDVAGKLQVTCKPRYKVGEVLYLKEPIANMLCEPDELVYKYSCPEINREFYKWSNKLFMPASDGRAFIRITGIKCERLLDISDEDCIAEGIKYFEIITDKKEKTGYKNYFYDAWFWHPKDSFISLYKFANKMKPTAEIKNIWVWAYQFEYLPDYKL